MAINLPLLQQIDLKGSFVLLIARRRGDSQFDWNRVQE
jgi:hypothetical protein